MLSCWSPYFFFLFFFSVSLNWFMSIEPMSVVCAQRRWWATNLLHVKGRKMHLFVNAYWLVLNRLKDHLLVNSYSMEDLRTMEWEWNSKEIGRFISISLTSWWRKIWNQRGFSRVIHPTVLSDRCRQDYRNASCICQTVVQPEAWHDAPSSWSSTSNFCHDISFVVAWY